MSKACMKAECLGHLEQFSTRAERPIADPPYGLTHLKHHYLVTLSICDECGGAWVHTLFDDTALQLTEGDWRSNVYV